MANLAKRVGEVEKAARAARDTRAELVRCGAWPIFKRHLEDAMAEARAAMPGFDDEVAPIVERALKNIETLTPNEWMLLFLVWPVSEAGKPQFERGPSEGA